jgi:hypothetical protein
LKDMKLTGNIHKTDKLRMLSYCKHNK